MQARRGGEGEKRSAYNGDADDLFRSLSRKEEKGRPDHRCEVMRARYWPGQSLAVDFFFRFSPLFAFRFSFSFLFRLFLCGYYTGAARGRRACCAGGTADGEQVFVAAEIAESASKSAPQAVIGASVSSPTGREILQRETNLLLSFPSPCAICAYEM